MSVRLVTAGSLAVLCAACGAAPTTPAPTAAKAEATQERIESSAGYRGPKIRVAVGQFEELEAAKVLMEKMGWAGITPLITEQITTGLVNTGRVAVLERAQIGKLVGNIKLEQQGDMAEFFDQKTTVEKGKFLGAQAILVGAVTEFEPNVSGGDGGLGGGDLLGLKHHTNKAVIGIDVRLVEQETGKVLYAAHATGEIYTNESGLTLGYQGVKLGGGAWTKTPLGAATRQAANGAMKKLTASIKQMAWEGRVIHADGKTVVLAGGTELNLKRGDRFRIVHRKAITGADGEVIAFDETEGGWVELTAVQDKKSVGKVLEGETPKEGDLVRGASAGE